mgnify:CR=1 FL=1
MAKMTAEELRIQAQLDRSARLGDKGPTGGKAKPMAYKAPSKLAPSTSMRPKPRPKNLGK